MTVAALADYTFAGTLPAITRTSDHIYRCRGVTAPGVTSILRILDKPALIGWAAKQAAGAAVRLVNQLPQMIAETGPDGAILALSNRANFQRDEAAHLGTEVHRLAQLVVEGQPTPPLDGAVRDRVLKYAEWWQRSGWTLRAAEALVFHPNPDGQPWGGTFDLLARDPDGKTVLADIKTGGSGVFRETILQLTAYGMSKYVSLQGSTALSPMPLADRYVALHVTASGVREIEINVGQNERMAWLACTELWAWAQTVKGRL